MKNSVWKTFMELSLVRGIVPRTVFGLTAIAAIILIIGLALSKGKKRGRLHPLIVSLIAAVLAGAAGLLVAWLVSDVFMVFGVSLGWPVIFTIAGGIAGVGFVIAAAVTLRGVRRALAVVLVPLVLLSTALGVESIYGEYQTIGTLVGTASRAGMVDKDGNMPRMREALLADAVGTVTGACTGTSTVTTFVESASGVEAGGRTGLTALTTGLLFLASMFLAPIAAVIPAAATSSALIYVGLLMLGGLKKIDFDDIYQSLPVAIMLISMPVSGSIGHGIGLGLISYSVLKLCTGKGKDVSLLTYAISLLFLVKFFLVA